MGRTRGPWPKGRPGPTSFKMFTTTTTWFFIFFALIFSIPQPQPPSQPLLGDTPSCMYPLIYPIHLLYFTFISLCLHTYLLLFGYCLILSSSQYSHSLSHYYWNPLLFASLAALLSLYRLSTLVMIMGHMTHVGCRVWV